MPRFSIKDLMLAITLVACGFGMVVVLYKWPLGDLSAIAIWLGACALIGAGLLAPVHKKRPGAVIGAALAMIVVVVLIVLISHFGRGNSH